MDTLRRWLLILSGRPAVAAALGVVLAGGGLARAVSFEEELALAQDYFLVADYATALEKVESLLHSEAVPVEALFDVHLLQARCHLALGQTVGAVDAFCSVLRSDPDWRPEGEFLTADELVSFRRALDLCGPLPDLPRAAEVPDELPETFSEPEPDLRLPSAEERSRPWYRNPWVLGVAGGLTAGLVLVLQDSGGAEEPTSTLPDFPPPPR